MKNELGDRLSYILIDSFKEHGTVHKTTLCGTTQQS